MKKVLLLNVLLLLLLPVMVFSQTDGQQDQSTFRDRLIAKEKERKKSVLEYAKKNGIPITGTGVNGEFMYLHHIANNKPVYYSTRDNDSAYAGMANAFIRMGNNPWMPLENKIRLELSGHSYFSIKADEEIAAVYVLNSEGKYHYKSKSPVAKEIRIPTNNMHREAYIICIKTSSGLSAFTIDIN